MMQYTLKFSISKVFILNKSFTNSVTAIGQGKL